MSDEQKHTPGPWQAYRSSVPGPQEGMWQVAGEDCIADLWRLEESTHDAYELSEDEAEENAHLIAAAPELLKELKAAEWTPAHNDAKRCPSCRQRDIDGHKSTCTLAAALAKAEGKEATT